MAPRYYRKIIRITGHDSPNVRLALAEIGAGKKPSNRVIIPGVLPWEDYQKRLATWDNVRKCIGIDALFYEGAEVLMFPPLWLDRANRIADMLRGRHRQAEAIGIDPAEGGDKTSMSAVDRLGLIERVSKKTPDTSVITGEAIAFMRKHNVPPDRVAFDRGGGGKEHADRLREQGYPVRTVAFGESLLMDPKRGITRIEEKKENREERYAYVNRRSQMYGDLRLLLDPAHIIATGPKQIIGSNVVNVQGKWEQSQGFGIPAEYTTLREELAPIPLRYDGEGRLKLPPKNKRSENSTELTLVELIGHSPDEADSLVLAIHAMLYKVIRSRAGVS
jgi:hypothetical protein